MLWILVNVGLLGSWWQRGWAAFEGSLKRNSRNGLIAVGTVFVLAACDAPGTSIVVERFPVEVTLNVVAEGQPQTATRILQCRKVVNFGSSCSKCTYWGTATQRIVQPLPSGGSLLLNIRENFCRDLVEDGSVPEFDETTQASLAWVDDIRTPTSIEWYVVGNQSISDDMASAAKIRVGSLDLKFRRLEREPEGIGSGDREQIIWFDGNAHPPTRDGTSIFYRSTRAHVIRRSEWGWDPEIAVRVDKLRRQTLIQGDLEQRIREFSGNWTSNHPALTAKNPIFKTKPIIIPFRRDTDGVWKIDTSRTGILVFEFIGARENLQVDFENPTRINGTDYLGSRLVVYDPGEKTIYVVNKGQFSIY